MDYDLIPEERREEVRELIRKNEMRKLLEIHDTYRLTKYNYTCCGMNGMMEHYRYGLDNGLI